MLCDHLNDYLSVFAHNNYYYIIWNYCKDCVDTSKRQGPDKRTNWLALLTDYSPVNWNLYWPAPARQLSTRPFGSSVFNLVYLNHAE